MATMPSASAQGKLFVGEEDQPWVCVGGASIKGRRPNQEDVLMVHTDIMSGPITSQGDNCVAQGQHRGWAS